MFNFQEYNFPMLNKVRLPEITISAEEKKHVGLKENATNYEFLCQLTKIGLDNKQHKLNKQLLPKYFERAEYELSTFEELGFVDYVLLVWRVINKARELGAYIDPGRGSCAGSFVFALIGITGTLDVIEKGLLFERFVSKVRSKKEVINGITFLQGDLLCDVDLNLGGVRDKIVDWLNELYKDKTCKIAALSTFTGKILIKDVYKTINNAPEEDAHILANHIEKHFGIVEDIEKMPEKSLEFKEWVDNYPETFEVALNLRDLLRQKTSHASGLFLSFDNVYENFPLELNREKQITISYEMSDASKLGIKLDLLGLVSCSVIKEVSTYIKENLDEINLDNDPIIYDKLIAGEFLPYGLYQISADCMNRVVREVRPKNILELSDCNAIARPGALDYLKTYVKNANECPHPVFQDILKSSRNLCLYQESLMQMLIKVGFTADEAEVCRKIVGKKQVEKVKEWEQKIYSKIKENNFQEEVGKILWKILNDSAKYSFNRSHSLSVSKLGALTIYLKYKYPLEFYTACLNHSGEMPNPIEDISQIQKELRFFNIHLLPPHILKSTTKFIMENGGIRFPLSNIKGIAEKSIQKLENFKTLYSTKFDIFQAANECKISVGIFSSLVLVGSLDDMLTESRSKTFLEFILWCLLTNKEKEWSTRLGEQFNFNLIEIIKFLNLTQKDEKNKPIIKDSRMETLRRNIKPYNEIYKHNSKNEKFANWFFERELIGYAYSSNLQEIFNPVAGGDLIDIQNVLQTDENQKVRFIGQVSKVKTWKSKERKTPCLKLEIEDHTSKIDVLAFDTGMRETIQEIIDNNGRLPAEKDIVIVRGTKKSGAAVFADMVGSQDVSILTRVSELEKIK